MKVIGLLSFCLFVIACSKSPITGNTLFSPSSKPTADFNYQTEYQLKKMKLEESGDDCLLYDFTFSTTYPEINNNFEVVGQLYRPKRSNFKAPIVVLFPPTGGKNFLDENVAENLCESDIAVFLPTNDFTGIDQADPPPVEDHDHALRRVVAATKTFIQYSKEHYRLDGSKAGIFGASLGGIIGTFSMSVLPDISAGYFIVAGGDVPNILAHSTQERVVRLKNIRKQQEGFRNDEEYEAWLQANLSLEPLEYAVNIPTETVQMVISTNDSSVPTDNQYLLHEALGKPEHEVSSSGHVWTILNSMSGSSRGIIDFFNQRFSKANPRLPTN